MTLGEMIKKYRAENGLSMDEFAKKSHISKAYISVLENNKHPKTGAAVVPSIKTFKNAADAMGIPFDVLFNQLEGKVKFPSDDEELQILFDSATKLTESEKYVVTTFDLLNEKRQQQAISFLNYLLEEQQSEDRKTN